MRLRKERGRGRREVAAAPYWPAVSCGISGRAVVQATR